MEERCTIFLHIPKAAGSTLNTAFRWRYRSQMLTLTTLNKPLDAIEEFPWEKRAQARIVAGHVHYGIHEYIPRRCEYVTILREPVARVLSLYKYILRTTTHPLHDRFRRSAVGLEEYASGDMDGNQVDNGQTRQVAGIQSGDVGPDVLDAALRNLETFRVVGLMERFDESFILLRRALAWRVPIYVTRNASESGPKVEVTDEAIRIIGERNQADFALYEAAQRRFARDVEKAGPSYEREVSLFTRLNPLCDVVARRAEEAFIQARRSTRRS